MQKISVSFSWFKSPGFLKEVAPDVVRSVPLCGNLENMLF